MQGGHLRCHVWTPAAYFEYFIYFEVLLYIVYNKYPKPTRALSLFCAWLPVSYRRVSSAVVGPTSGSLSAVSANMNNMNIPVAFVHSTHTLLIVQQQPAGVVPSYRMMGEQTDSTCMADSFLESLASVTAVFM